MNKVEELIETCIANDILKDMAQAARDELRGIAVAARKPVGEREFKQMCGGNFWEIVKLMIVAGDYRQAKDFAHVMRIPKDQWRYAEWSIDFSGYRNIVIVTLGGMYQKEGVHEIMDTATTMARLGLAKIVHVEDWR